MKFMHFSLHLWLHLTSNWWNWNELSHVIIISASWCRRNLNEITEKYCDRKDLMKTFSTRIQSLIEMEIDDYLRDLSWIFLRLTFFSFSFSRFYSLWEIEEVSADEVEVKSFDPVKKKILRLNNFISNQLIAWCHRGKTFILIHFE